MKEASSGGDLSRGVEGYGYGVIPARTTAVISTLKIICGVGLVAVGVIALFYKASYANTGAGLWGGIIAAISGVLGVFTARNYGARPYVVAFFLGTCLALITDVVVVIYGATGLARDSGYPGGFIRDSESGDLIPVSLVNIPLREMAMLINLVIIILGVIEIILSLPSIVICLRDMCQCYDLRTQQYYVLRQQRRHMEQQRKNVVSWLHQQSQPIYVSPTTGAAYPYSKLSSPGAQHASPRFYTIPVQPEVPRSLPRTSPSARSQSMKQQVSSPTYQAYHSPFGYKYPTNMDLYSPAAPPQASNYAYYNQSYPSPTSNYHHWTGQPIYGTHQHYNPHHHHQGGHSHHHRLPQEDYLYHQIANYAHGFYYPAAPVHQPIYGQTTPHEHHHHHNSSRSQRSPSASASASSANNARLRTRVSSKRSGTSKTSKSASIKTPGVVRKAPTNNVTSLSKRRRMEKVLDSTDGELDKSNFNGMDREMSEEFIEQAIDSRLFVERSSTGGRVLPSGPSGAIVVQGGGPEARRAALQGPKIHQHHHPKGSGTESEAW